MSSLKWRSHSYCLDVDALLSVAFGATGKMLHIFDFKAPISRVRRLPIRDIWSMKFRRDFPMASMVWFKDITVIRNSTYVYGENFMCMKKYVFKNFCIPFWREWCTEKVEHEVWTVPAPFWTIQFLSSACYVSHGGTAESLRVHGLCKDNVGIYQT